jgi:hypothetical protein
MSYFDDASLVMIPSGYKDQKVYSVKPLDGSGDLTFSRASSATRVASNGLIEKVRTNLLLQSNTFSTTWATANATLTSGQNGYDGSSNAWLLKSNTSSAGHNCTQSVTTSNINTFSVYAKAGGYNYIALYSSGLVEGRFFNLSNGTVGNTMLGTPLDSKIETIGGGWYRCSVTFNGNISSAETWMSPDGSSFSFTGDGTSGIYIQNAQAETGDIATDYIATTTAAVSVGPVSGLPRLDYLNSTCPRLLLEPQRSSLVLYSEQQNNAAWTKAGATITANATASPDGYTNADKVVEDTSGGGTHGTYQSASVTSGTTYTWSGFFKAAERTAVEVSAQTSGTYNAKFNLSNGTVISVDSGATASVVNYGNGWYRCIISAPTASTTAFFNWWMLNSSNQGVYTGNGTSGVFAWGCQLEAGAYATSYIPTLGTSVTRVADVTTKTGISSLIGSTEGVLFVEADITLNSETSRIFMDVNDNDLTNRVVITISNNVIGGFVQGVTRVSYTIPSSGRYKIAFGYKSGDFVLYVNGVQRSTSSASVTFSGMNQLFLGHTFAGTTTQPSDPIAQALLFKTRLTNAQLAELTTL